MALCLLGRFLCAYQSMATVTTEINVFTVLHSRYLNHCAVHKGHGCPCAALVLPKRPPLPCAVSVGWRPARAVAAPYLPMQLGTGKARHSMVGANGTFQWLWGPPGCLWHCSARNTCAYTQHVRICELHLLTHGQDCWLIPWLPAQPFVEEILQ